MDWFLRKHEAIYGQFMWAWKGLVVSSHTWWVLRTRRMLEWMIQKKKGKKSYAFSPFSSFLTKATRLHLPALVSWPKCIFSGPLAECGPPKDGFNSHLCECDDVTAGLWHTWVNNTVARQIRHASDDSRAVRSASVDETNAVLRQK